MSIWDDRKAEVVQTIGEAEKALINRSDGALVEEDAAAMTKVLAVARARLGAAPAVLIAPEAAAHIESGAKRLIALLQSGVGDTPRDIVGLLAVGSAWVTHETRDEDLGSAAADVAAAARERLSALDAQIDARSHELDQRAKLVEDGISTVRADIEGLRASLADLDTKRVESESAIQNALTTQAETFRTAQNEREEHFTAGIHEWSEAARTSYDEWNGDAARLIEEMTEMRDGAKEVVGATAGLLTAERFENQVAAERRRADWLRVTALVLICAAGALAFWAAHGGTTSSDWRQFAGKALTAVTLATAAGYAGAQSGQHRAREGKYRQLAIELAAFGPFIAPLDDEERRMARIVMADRIFGRHIEGLPPPDGEMPSLVSRLLDQWRAAMKSDGGR